MLVITQPGLNRRLSSYTVSQGLEVPQVLALLLKCEFCWTALKLLPKVSDFPFRDRGCGVPPAGLSRLVSTSWARALLLPQPAKELGL